MIHNIFNTGISRGAAASLKNGFVDSVAMQQMSEIEIPMHLVTLCALRESTVSYTSHTQPYTSGTCKVEWHIHREPLEFFCR